MSDKKISELVSVVPVASDVFPLSHLPTDNVTYHAALSDAIAAILPSQGGHVGEFLKTDGSVASWAAVSASASAADPTAEVSLTAVNGVLTSFMRSDAAPALSQAIVPTWTGIHTFLNDVKLGAPVGAARALIFYNPDSAFSASIAMFDGEFMSSDITMQLPSQSGTLVDEASAPLTISETGVMSISAAALSTANDTNVHIDATGAAASALLAAVTITASWVGTLADARITSASTWNSKQAGSANLSSLSSLSYVSTSFVKMTAANTFALDTSTYLTANQTITLSGDISGSGATAITTAIGANKVQSSMLNSNVFANPTVSVTLSIQNGSATTAMRSDAAPPLSQSIAPTWTSLHTFATAARSSLSAHYHSIVTPADTGIATTAESVGIQFGGTNALTPLTVTRQWATGSVTTQREYLFTAPTYSAVAASTFGNVATVAITGAPVAGVNATLNTPMALWVQSGASYFDGTTFFNSLATFAGADFDGAVIMADTVEMRLDLAYLQLTGLQNGILYANNGQQVQAISHAADGAVLSSKGTTTTPAYRTLISTTNQVTVTAFAGTFVFSAPQDIATISTPQFARLGLGVAADATSPLLIQTAALPTRSQFQLKTSAANAGVIALLHYTSDNHYMSFDVLYDGGWVAKHAAVAWFHKSSAKFFLSGSTGNTIGNAPTQNEYLTMDLSNGFTSIATGAGDVGVVASCRLQIDGIVATHRVSYTSETILAAYGAVIPSDYEIASNHVIELGNDAIMEII